MRAFPLFGILLILVALYPLSAALADNAPPLPAGLEAGESSTSDAPLLPAGLGAGESSTSDAPSLPAGLGAGVSSTTYESTAPAGTEIDVSGFWEASAGTRTRSDPYERQTSLLESRLQFSIERPGDTLNLKLTGDLLYDDVADSHDVHLETGEGYVDLREAWLFYRPADRVDLKAGRQVLTWGTGDLLFINDLFPKDFRSFFIGRDVEYLKAPSDAVKLSLFSDAVSLDLVYTPRFDANRYIDGRRISFFNPATGTITGRDNTLNTRVPDDWFDDDELAARLYTNWHGYELVAYGYTGFWKGPMGSDPVSGQAIFPELDVLGLSVRGNLWRGIGHTELGYYHSGDDSSGRDPYIANSELRFLVGYEQEIARETTLGLQYYLEHMQDYDRYRDNLPAGTPKRDHNRHVVTVRLTWLVLQQDLRLSVFNFYSPSDEDGYLRAGANYRLDDNWSLSGGVNLFYGDEKYTFFGQLEKNSNVYTAIRYGFGS
jgi:hypothetical protein